LAAVGVSARARLNPTPKLNGAPSQTLHLKYCSVGRGGWRRLACQHKQEREEGGGEVGGGQVGRGGAEERGDAVMTQQQTV
jgi:hypothetical protein